MKSDIPKLNGSYSHIYMRVCKYPSRPKSGIQKCILLVKTIQYSATKTLVRWVIFADRLFHILLYFVPTVFGRLEFTCIMVPAGFHQYRG